MQHLHIYTNKLAHFPQMIYKHNFNFLHHFFPIFPLILSGSRSSQIAIMMINPFCLFVMLTCDLYDCCCVITANALFDLPHRHTNCNSFTVSNQFIIWRLKINFIYLARKWQLNNLHCNRLNQFCRLNYHVSGCIYWACIETSQRATFRRTFMHLFVQLMPLKYIEQKRAGHSRTFIQAWEKTHFLQYLIEKKIFLPLECEIGICNHKREVSSDNERKCQHKNEKWEPSSHFFFTRFVECCKQHEHM